MDVTQFSWHIQPNIYITGNEMPSTIATYLKRRLQGNIAAVPPDSKAHHIYLTPVDTLLTEAPSEAALQMHALYGFWAIQHQDGIYIYFFKCTKAVAAIKLSAKGIEIQYLRHAKVARKLANLVVYCVHYLLMQQSCLLLHAAALQSPAGKQYLLFGQRGIGKSTLVHALVHRGWRYLSDDKLLFCNGKLLRYQSKTHILDHHRNALPWLHEKFPPAQQSGIAPWLRQRLRHLLRQYLPPRLLPNEDRLLNNGNWIDLTQLYASHALLDQSSPDVLIVLLNADTMNKKIISKTQAIQYVDYIQQLANHEFAPLDNMLALLQSQKRTDFTGLLNQRLKVHTCYQIEVPTSATVEQLIQVVTTC